jgi:ubiquitin-like protein Pup
MAERTQKPRTSPERRHDDETVDDTETVAGTGDKLIAELDDLLDEIDEVLESNAEDFVKSYVQKGGQ